MTISGASLEALRKVSTDYINLKATIKALADKFEVEGLTNTRASKKGSPVTSMAEDGELTLIGREQLRIARLLRATLDGNLKATKKVKKERS